MRVTTRVLEGGSEQRRLPKELETGRSRGKPVVSGTVVSLRLFTFNYNREKKIVRSY